MRALAALWLSALFSLGAAGACRPYPPRPIVDEVDLQRVDERVSGEAVALPDWPGARCSRDFCTMVIARGDRAWTLLMARSRERIEERALAAACERSDLVIADRWLPRSCRPRWLKADRAMLEKTGGLSLYLEEKRIATVAQAQGEHGWWRPPAERPLRRPPPQ